MSDLEVQLLYDQLRKLRGQLPEFLQAWTSLDDAGSSKIAFYHAAKALGSWSAETQAFIASYERLKPKMEEAKNNVEDKPEDSAPQQQPAQQDVSQQDFGLSGLDSFSNDFFDLT